MPRTLNKLPPLHQLPFPFHLHEKYTFENFYHEPNTVVTNCLKQLIKQPNFTHAIYLWGQSGTGCTHLLKACVELVNQTGLKATYLSLALNQTTNLIDAVQSSTLLCLDDVDAIAGNPIAEEHLFTAYNHLTTKGIPMVFAAHQVPHNLPFTLADLVSRLNSGLLFKIHPLSDTQKIAALQLRAQVRGYELPKPVAQFLLFRLHRNPSVLLEAFNQLELFALAHKRRLTMPLVKDVLGL